MLRVLITNNHMFRRGGSETFTRTLADEFRRRGDEVQILVPDPGVYSLRSGHDVISQPGGRYDLILVSHNTCLPKVSFCKGPKVFTSHGIFPELEQPHPGADHYVAVSEEVRNHLQGLGFAATVIRNGVNCDTFQMTRPPGEKLGRVLCMAQGDEAKAIVQTACQKLKIESVLLTNVPESHLVNHIDRADLVVSLGRGAYEAMAAGRAVLIYDSRWYMQGAFCDGLVTRKNWSILATHNFSGRASSRKVGLGDIIDLLERYRQSMSAVNRVIAFENFNVRKQVEAYIELVS